MASKSNNNSFILNKRLHKISEFYIVLIQTLID
jgi:hypothetical protein